MVVFSSGGTRFVGFIPEGETLSNHTLPIRFRNVYEVPTIGVLLPDGQSISSVGASFVDFHGSPKKTLDELQVHQIDWFYFPDKEVIEAIEKSVAALGANTPKESNG